MIQVKRPFPAFWKGPFEFLSRVFLLNDQFTSCLYAFTVLYAVKINTAY